MSGMAGESIMSTLVKHVQVFAVDMGTALLEQSAFAMKRTMVSNAESLHFLFFNIFICSMLSLVLYFTLFS